MKCKFILLLCLAISYKLFPQTVTIYQTGFENVPGNYVLSLYNQSQIKDYWATNDTSIQSYQSYSFLFCNPVDELRNMWGILNNNTYGDPSQYSISGNSLGMSALWGPQGLTWNQSGYNCNHRRKNLCGAFDCFYDVQTDRWAYRIISTANYTNLTLTFQWKCGGTDAFNNNLYYDWGQVGWSTDGGNSWNWITDQGGVNNTGLYYGSGNNIQNTTISLPIVCNNQAQFAIAYRFYIPSGLSTGPSLPTFVIDNIQLTGVPGNMPPNCSSYNYPANGASGISVNPTLLWSNSSTASGYNIYLDTNNPPTTLVSSNQQGTTYNATNLQQGATYYWKIMPVNNYGGAAGCQVWSFTTQINCVPPTLTAEANGSSGIYAGCPRGGNAILNLTANPSGGSGCSGTFAYSWSNGSNYWDGNGFNLTSPTWNEAYSSITVTSTDSVKYKVYTQCTNLQSCASTGNITTIILRDPSFISTNIGNPANGLENHMTVNWGKVNGGYYNLQYSLDALNWSPATFNGIGTTFDSNLGEYPNGPCFYRVQSYNGFTSCGDWVTQLDSAFTACDFPVLAAGNPQMTTVGLSLQNDFNPVYTLYSVKCQTTGQFLQADGTLGTTEIYQTKLQWGSIIVKGLSAGTQYCFYASAQNKRGNIQTQGPATTICITTLNCNLPIIASQYPSNVSTIGRCSGDTISFIVNATGQAPFSYQWNVGGTAITGKTNSVYKISKTGSNDENYYNCIISNNCGSITSGTTVLYIYSVPVMNVSQLILHKQTGDSILFNVSPTGGETYSYQWLKDGKPIPGATTGTYLKKNITTADAGIYYCDASDMCGSTTQAIATVLVGNSNLFGLYGLITYDNKGATPLNKTQVTVKNIEGTYTNTVTTDTTGHYLITNLASDKYIITVSTTKATGGINPLDALIVNRYFIKAITTFGDALKKKAADVNVDGKINPADALLINRRFIHAISAFKAGNWQFQTDTVNLNSDIQVNLKGICTGDVNGDYSNIPY